MVRRVTVLLMLLVMLLTGALAEDPSPATLREAKTVEAVEAFLCYPPEDGETAGVQRGYIRYIAQHRINDPEMFRQRYWLGGPVNSELDLTRETKPGGEPYAYSASSMCTRAAYSMALSYLGIDVTPGDMSATTGRRDLDTPYTEITAILGIERVTEKAYVFNRMMENYLNDPSFSPVLVHLRRRDGSYHAVLVVAAMADPGWYIAVDPSAVNTQDGRHRVYMVSLNKPRNGLTVYTFRGDLRDSEVIGLYQWRLPETQGE